MSKHATLELHESEESITCVVEDYLKESPPWNSINPISEYFSVTSKLTLKIATSDISDDAEILGLFSIGIISAAEFYFRSVLGLTIAVCPVARRHFEMSNIPSGAHSFYEGSGLSYAIGCLEHESLADAKKIKTECKKFTDFTISEDKSTSKAIDDFDLLCELRHCIVHSQGYVGLKASKALRVSSRTLHKVLLTKEQALEVVKLSHNAVRAMNRYLANSIANRWIDADVLTGHWRDDREAFNSLFHAFSIRGENKHQDNPYTAYRPFQKAAVQRKAGLLAKT